MQTVYTQILITPSPSGFGMYQTGDLQVTPTSSYASRGDLIDAIAANTGHMLPIDEALTDPTFREYGIQDLRGRIYGRHGELWAEIECGVISYFGIIESEVSDNFFD